jgi:hypothetical protein
MATDFAPDWFNPNDRGYRIWSDIFWSAIAPTFRRGQEVEETRKLATSADRARRQEHLR